MSHLNIVLLSLGSHDQLLLHPDSIKRVVKVLKFSRFMAYCLIVERALLRL